MPPQRFPHLLFHHSSIRENNGDDDDDDDGSSEPVPEPLFVRFSVKHLSLLFLGIPINSLLFTLSPVGDHTEGHTVTIVPKST